MRVNKQALLSFIQERGMVTFEDIEGFFERSGYRYKGKEIISLLESHRVAWSGWNKRAANAFLDLWMAGEIVLRESDALHPAPVPKPFRRNEALYRNLFVRAIICAKERGM